MVRKGRLVVFGGPAGAISAAVTEGALDHSCIGVRVDSVVESIVRPDLDSDWTIPDEMQMYPPLPSTPPYRTMWMEFSATGQFGRGAMYVQRTEVSVVPSQLRKQITARQHLRDGVEDRWAVMITTMLDFNGEVLPIPVIETVWLGADGRPNAYTGFGFPDLEETIGRRIQDMTGMLRMHARGTITAMQSLARFNCKNIELRRIETITPSENKSKRAKVAMSVWHEIVVASVPNIRRSSAAFPGDGESVEIRLHWVRGHYADYSKGNGLFGNPKLKAVFWMPEHRRGTENLGEVASSYCIVQ